MPPTASAAAKHCPFPTRALLSSVTAVCVRPQGLARKVSAVEARRAAALTSSGAVADAALARRTQKKVSVR
jgi:hypothetical protein